MFKKLFNRKNVKLGGILALVIGVVSQLLGVDLAPAEIDTIITSLSTLAALGVELYERYQESKKSGT